VRYGKEDYFDKLKELGLQSDQGVTSLKEQAREWWKKFPTKYIHGFQNIAVAGDYIFNSKNVANGYDSELTEDSKFIQHGQKAKNCYDGYVVVDGSELANEVVSVIAVNNVKSSYCIWHGYDIEYSDTCLNSHHLFGCVGLQKKEYCILNKQYAKEEYEMLVVKIREEMAARPYVDKQGRRYGYGEYFPGALSPFAYNETAAQEYFPLAREEAIKQGFTWKAPEERKVAPTMKSSEIPDSILEVAEDITSQIIECAHQNKCADQCTSAFRITPAEWTFYKQNNLPLPRLCFNCRHHERFGMRNSLSLYSRLCMCAGQTTDDEAYRNTGKHIHEMAHCETQFQTTYGRDRPEIVYCEACYQSEVV
jgi:hypothetical protein